LNGLYDAKLDKVPVLAITGQVESDLLGTDSFQEVKLERLFDDVAVYNQRIMSAEQLPAVVNQAVRTAYAKKGVAVLTVPDDIPLIFNCDGLITAKGGATSHAAVTAASLGKVCIVSCKSLTVDDEGKRCRVNGGSYTLGDKISIDGSLGFIYEGFHEVRID
jgi:phosphoenolpyruvate synthase/pyruvate phosphate dikinase